MDGEKVLVTTSYRGVFFGTLIKREGDIVTLADARNCLYWPAELKGFLGLASRGPVDGSRIGPAVSSVELFGVTSITKCTAEAVERWEKGPWQ